MRSKREETGVRETATDLDFRPKFYHKRFRHTPPWARAYLGRAGQWGAGPTKAAGPGGDPLEGPGIVPVTGAPDVYSLM